MGGASSGSCLGDPAEGSDFGYYEVIGRSLDHLLCRLGKFFEYHSDLSAGVTVRGVGLAGHTARAVYNPGNRCVEMPGVFEW
jgi:hypothetical protein